MDIVWSHRRRLEFVKNHRTKIGCGTVLALWLLSRKQGWYVEIAAWVAGAIAMWLLYRRSTARWPATNNRAVLITGCDSGLGYSLALHTHRMGLTVIAACFKSDGDGAKQLKEICGPNRLFIIELDITNEDSVNNAVIMVRAILQGNPDLELKALVNNAGVMVFGEFEWQTESLVNNQVAVNFLGTMRVTKAFIPFMRLKEGRIITVTSHCALQTLPGLAVYGGTKAALKAWSDGLRIELAKYGIAVISFVPGSFSQQSNIMSRHLEHMLEMANGMTVEARIFYEDYFFRYNDYLCRMSGKRDPVQLLDEKLYLKYEDALLSHQPLSYYEHGPIRYMIYHFLFKISPTWLGDYLVEKFMQMPKMVKD